MYTRQLDQAGFKAKLSCYYSSLRIKPFSMQIKLSSCLEKKAVVARIVCTSLETSQIITQSKHIQRMTWEVDETRIFCRKLRFPRCLYVLYMIYVYIHIYIYPVKSYHPLMVLCAPTVLLQCTYQIFITQLLHTTPPTNILESSCGSAADDRPCLSKALLTLAKNCSRRLNKSRLI